MASRRQGNEADPFGEPREEMTLDGADALLFGNINPMIRLADLRLDGGTQPRASLDQTTIREYADDMRNGDRFPPVTVFYDGTDHWLADGFHRVAAAALADLDKLRADIKQGTRRDAVLFSVGVNASHGKRRTNADKRRAVMTMLSDTEWSGWSDREIARQCRVSQPFVGKMRGELVSDNGYQIDDSEPETRTVRRGDQVFEQRVSSETRRAANQARPHPLAPSPAKLERGRQAEPVGRFENANGVGNLPHPPAPSPHAERGSGQPQGGGNARLSLLVADLEHFGKLAATLAERVETMLTNGDPFPPSALGAVEDALDYLEGYHGARTGQGGIWVKGLLDLLNELHQREVGGDGTDG